MRKHTTRTIVIAIAIVVSLIYVYPTIGYTFFMDDAERAELRAKIEEEDSVYTPPSFFQDTKTAIRRWWQFNPDQVINLGLDLQGGIHMIVEFDEDDVPEELKKLYDGYEGQIQQQVLQSIRRRMDDFEAKEPTIQTLGSNQIQIQLPGEKNLERAENLILKTAVLNFHIQWGPEKSAQVLAAIHDHFNSSLLPFLEQDSLSSSVFRVPVEHYDRVKRIVDEAKEVPGLIPEDVLVLFSPQPNPWDDQYYEIHVVNSEPEMTGEGLRTAVARPDDQRGGGKILFEFDAKGAEQFADVTGAHINEALAIVLDGVCVSAPNINDRIFGSGEIAGQFSLQQAQDLAIALTSGALPVPIRQASSAVIGPSLGHDSIEKGITSALWGMIVVIVFMFVYYRLAGVIANVTLVCNALFIIAAMAYFDTTLTLPGIAGLILTIGMAVDANVLIYERIREELRNGRSLLASIESGFEKAGVTILDANVTTLIAAAVLMEFGSGPVEGFAITLMIGVCSSVFCALVLCRAMFDFLSERKLVTKLTMMSVVPPDTKIPFMKGRRVWVPLSIVLIIAGLGLVAVRGEDMYGVDFKTGTNMDVVITNDTVLSEEGVRTSLSEIGYANATVQAFENYKNRFNIRIGAESVTEGAMEDGETVRAKVAGALAKLTTDPATETGLEFMQVQSVGPAVGQQLKTEALLAVAYSMFFIIVYLWFRFELRFAVGALVALAHDVAMTLGIFALTGREISLTVVAAILTVIGYSLNDTIVVFDRIRENLRLFRGRDYTLDQVMDISVNQTLSRTLLTALTTLFVLVVLFIFGGEAIEDFAFALIVGIVVGTYSSVYIASPVVYYWEVYFGKKTIEGSQRGGPGGRRRRQLKPRTTEEAAEQREIANP